MRGVRFPPAVSRHYDEPAMGLSSQHSTAGAFLVAPFVHSVTAVESSIVSVCALSVFDLMILLSTELLLLR